MSLLKAIPTLLLFGLLTPLWAQKTIIVRPKEIDDVLINPGIGFMTFQRFNGDQLNAPLQVTEGFPIEYQPFDGDLTNENHPQTSIAYFRIYWRYVEPVQGQINWEMLDKALDTAHQRGQTLMLRIAPHGRREARDDVPVWYRKLVGEEPPGSLPREKWKTDPEDPRYVKYFGGMIRRIGARYDGHPDLESVDLSIVGSWGEGDGVVLLSQKTRLALIDAYLESFKKTPLLVLLYGKKSIAYSRSKRAVGWRQDCLGDMGIFFDKQPNWTHMQDYYPQAIIRNDMQDAWEKAPVSFEVCSVMQRWKNEGWDIDYIIDQSLKWHTSSINAKSSAVPKEWEPHVNRWLKKLGYRFVLRKFTYPEQVRANGTLSFTSWWENKGVAPSYKRFPLALRLRSKERTEVLVTDADVRNWLPGDSLYDDAVFVPFDLPPGMYDLELALLDPRTQKPKVKLAIEGEQGDGWYGLGKIKIVR